MRDTTGRVDRNVVSLKALHKYSSTSSVDVMYTNSFTRGENDDQENTDYNQLAG